MWMAVQKIADAMNIPREYFVPRLNRLLNGVPEDFDSSMTLRHTESAVSRIPRTAVSGSPAVLTTASSGIAMNAGIPAVESLRAPEVIGERNASIP